MNSNSVKNLLIAVLVILALSLGVGYCTKDKRGQNKELQERNKVLSDSVDNLSKENDLITLDLNEAKKELTKDSLDYVSALKGIQESLTELKNLQYANKKKITTVANLDNSDTDSLYSRNVAKYSARFSQ